MNINYLFSARSSPVHINMLSAFRGWNARTYIYGIRVQRVILAHHYYHYHSPRFVSTNTCMGNNSLVTMHEEIRIASTVVEKNRFSFSRTAVKCNYVVLMQFFIAL